MKKYRVDSMDFIIIPDTAIDAFNVGKRDNEASSILFRDAKGRSHEIYFETCAMNYTAEHTNSSGKCVGERNISEGYFIFYTSGIKTKIIFKKRHVRDLFHSHILRGSRTDRFHALNNLIQKTLYTTYDLS